LHFDRKELAILATMLGASFVIRLLLFPQQGYPIDTGDFIAWFTTAAQHGVRPFYSLAGYADYPPFNVYIFWAFGALANLLNINMAAMVKLVPNIFDLGTAALIYLFVRKQASFKTAMLSTALYAFNPATIYNSAVWGQFDAVYTFFLILSLMLALKAKPLPSAVAYALGILTKPQGIALLPLLILLIYKKNGLRSLLISIGAFAATVLLVVLPFEGVSNPNFLVNLYTSGYTYYHVTSANAFNLWGLIALWMNDGVLFYVGWALFGVVAAFTLFLVNKRLKISGDLLAIFAAFILFFAFFMFPTRIHERYMFPAISMLALLFPLVKKVRLLYVALTGTLLANQAYVLYWLNASYPNAAPNLTGDPVVLVVGLINVVMFLYGSLLMWNEIKGKSMFKADLASVGDKERQGEIK
jgi:Gpi18-like mannosyltransferase